MSIIRTKKENNFVLADKTWINDNRLSAKAKGIMIYLLSKPDNWTVRIADIVNHMKDGRDSVSAGMKELQEHGYIVRKQVRFVDGTFGEVEYIVFECPVVQMLEESNTNNFNLKAANGKSENGKADTTNKELNNNDFKKEDDDYINESEKNESIYVLEFIEQAQQNNLPMSLTKRLVNAIKPLHFNITTLKRCMDIFLSRWKSHSVASPVAYMKALLVNEQEVSDYNRLSKPKPFVPIEGLGYNWLGD